MASGMPANMTPEEKAKMGAQLSAAAYLEPPIVPTDLARWVVIITSTTVGLATIVIALRCYVRLTMKQSARSWAWEDTFAVLGYAAFSASSIFSIKAAFYGLEYMLYSQVLYGASMPLIKASVVFMLLRFTTERKYRWTLYGMQTIATLMAVVGILASLLYCRPVPAYWNPLLGKCGDFMVVVRIGYAWTAVGIATDWTCSILPWFVVRKLQMSQRTKITVMVILGLGSVASTATIVRAPYLKYYLVEQDRLYWNGHIMIWCILESGIGIIAASLPALRSLFVRWLDATQYGSRYGSGNKSSGSKAGYGKQGSGLRTIGGSDRNANTPLNNLDSQGKRQSSRTSDGKWKRLDDECSTKGIIQERVYEVESESLSDVEAGGNRMKQEKYVV